MILAFDTSTAQGSVAVLESKTARVLSERVWRRERSHSEFLTAEIELALQDANSTIKDVSLIAVGQGPGSFTGIRVAVNAARALAYALAIPVSVFETAESLVEPVSQFEIPVMTIINAQKNAFFVSTFSHVGDQWSRLTETTLLTLQDLEQRLTKPHLCLGDGCADVEKLLATSARLNWIRDEKASDYPLASSLGRLAVSRAKLHPPMVWNAVQPLYIRASGAEENLRR